MRPFFGYIRVSTARQGDHGVSLEVQREAILRHAQEHDFSIVAWFEERQTAAKRGRPFFSRMIDQLRQNRADGVIMHKIDRGARNLRDWADLGELLDTGIAVEFAGETLDLNSRGGRLTADIQAVVAVDFIRNLREETRKGMLGRLKQGYFPFPAPLGYLNQGGGKIKMIDPVRGPLIRELFLRHAAGQYTLTALTRLAQTWDLRSWQGLLISRSFLGRLLRNPFYAGLMIDKTTQHSYQGLHEPLVEQPVFDRVQAQLSRLRQRGSVRHNFLYRGLFTCGVCQRQLIGELHKGHVYYRCHATHRPRTGVREEALTSAITETFSHLEPDVLISRLRTHGPLRFRDAHEQQTELNRELARTALQLKRLADLYIEGEIEKNDYHARRIGLATIKAEQEKKLRVLDDPTPANQRVNLLQIYQSASFQEQRELILCLTERREVAAKQVLITPQTE